MVNMAVLPLIHVPPGTELLIVIVLPIHTAVGPVETGGNGLTVTGVVIAQEVPNV